MKIRNLNDYVRSIINQDVPKDLRDSENPFFQKLMGEDTDLRDHVGNLSNIATDPPRQLIFEFLQNAEDANADSFFLFFDEGHLLVVNNGDSLRTDRSKYSGELFSFLGIGKGKKTKESNKIGKFGKGSKLLYDLFLDIDPREDELLKSHKDRLNEKIIDQVAGPILFSWKNWSSIDHLSDAHMHTFSLGDYTDLELPLLSKILFTYYPSMPGEQREEINGKIIDLFPVGELNSFIHFFNKIFPGELKHLLHKGGLMIYIPLGVGLAKYLGDKIIPEIIPNITTSIALLENVKTIWINNRKIQKHDFHRLSLEIDPPLGLPFQFMYPKNPSQRSAELANFYNFFPVADEVHGFNFFIHSEGIELDQSRQRIDANETQKRNPEIIQGIGEKLYSYVKELVTADKQDEFIALMKAVITSNPKENAQKTFREKIYNPLIDALSSNLPTTSGFVNNTANIFIRGFDLEIDPKVTGIDELYWLDPLLADYYNEVEEKLGVKTYTLMNLLESCHQQRTFQSWLSSLENPELQRLFSVLWTETEGKIASIKGLKLFEGSDQQFYSLQDIDTFTNTFLATPKVRNVGSILKKLGLVVCGEQLDWTTDFGRNLALFYEKDQESLFERVVTAIDATKLNHQDKWILFKNFLNNFDRDLIGDLLRNELVLFCNANGESLPLSSLLFDSRSLAQSGLLAYYQITDIEKAIDLQEPFFMEEEEVWEQLMDDWEEQIVPALEARLAIADHLESVYEDLHKLASLAGKAEIDTDDKRIVYAKDGKFHLEKDVYWNSRLAEIDSHKFSLVKKLIQEITNYDCFNNIEQYEAFRKGPFVISEKGYAELKEYLSGNEIIMDRLEVELLSTLGKNGSDYLFGHFVLEQASAEGRYLIRPRAHAQYEYFSTDADLNAFLSDKKELVCLPAELKTTFEQDQKLRQIDEEFVRSLIAKYGPAPEFINVVRSQSDTVCREYIQQIPRVDLYSNVERYPRYSFQSRLLEIAQSRKLKDLVVDKIYIDNKPLNQVNVDDRITLQMDKGNDPICFSLARLLPEKYEGVSDLFQQVRSLFDIGFSSIFKSRRIESWEVKKDLLASGVSNAEHIAFLVAYKLSDEGKDDPSLRDVSTLDLAGIPQEAILDRFFQKNLRKFSQCFHFPDFEPQEKILAPDETLLLPSESLPAWVADWLKSNGDHKLWQEKVVFLKKAGVGKPDHPVLALRLSLKNDQEIDPGIMKKVVEDGFFLNNTLQWAKENLQEISSSSNQAKILMELIRHSANQAEWPGFYMQLVSCRDDEEKVYQINSHAANTTQYFYDEPLFLPRLLEGLQKQGGVLASAEVELFGEQLGGKLQAYGFRKVWVIRKLIEEELGKEKEWTEDYYVEWRKREGKEYRIRLFGGKIPFKYELHRAGFAPSLIGSHRDGDYGAHTLDDGIKEILVNEQAVADSSVLDMLQEHREELFGEDKDALLALFRYAMPKKEEKSLLAIIKDQGLTESELRDLIANQGSGSGNVQLDEDLEKHQQAVINKLANFLHDQEKWEAFERHMDQMLAALDHLEEEAKPDSVVGFIGEQLMVQWLTIRNENAKVERVADTTAEYDIVLRLPQGEFEIDVKTTIKSVQKTHAPLPFYIKQSQYKYVQRPDKKDNYYISRISLEDLGPEMVQLARKHQSLEGNENAIISAVKGYMSHEENQKHFRDMHMTFRLSYDYQIADFL